MSYSERKLNEKKKHKRSIGCMSEKAQNCRLIMIRGQKQSPLSLSVCRDVGHASPSTVYEGTLSPSRTAPQRSLTENTVLSGSAQGTATSCGTRRRVNFNGRNLKDMKSRE